MVSKVEEGKLPVESISVSESRSEAKKRVGILNTQGIAIVRGRLVNGLTGVYKTMHKYHAQ